MGKNKLSNESIKFYDALLDGIETDNLPFRDLEENEEGENWIENDFSLEKDFGDDISEKAYFITAFSYLLCKFNMLKNIVFNNYDVNDNRISPFVFSYDDGDSINDKLLKSKSLLDDLSKNDVIFSELVNKYDLNNEIDFIYQASADNSLNAITLNTICTGDNSNIASPKIIFEVLKKDAGKFKVKLGIRSDMFSEGFSKSFLTAFIKISEEFLKKEKFADVDLLYDDDIKKLDSFFGVKLAYDKNETIVSMINEQIKLHPNNITVSCDGKKYYLC